MGVTVWFVQDIPRIGGAATTGDAFSFDNATLVSFTWHEKTVTAIFKTGL